MARVLAAVTSLANEQKAGFKGTKEKRTRTSSTSNDSWGVSQAKSWEYRSDFSDFPPRSLRISTQNWGSTTEGVDETYGPKQGPCLAQAGARSSDFFHRNRHGMKPAQAVIDNILEQCDKVSRMQLGGDRSRY